MSTITDKPVYIYNTLTRKRELFQPLNPPRVGIYSCGPTVYKDIHVGNFRTFMMTDWLRRMLEYNGYDVYLVRNITDVGHLQNDDVESGEDKLEYEARTTGRSAYDIAQHYTAQYMRDAAELNILPPHLSPKATDHIDEMLAMTQALVEKGLAYIADGNVYYDVAQFPEYGKLSGNTVENLRAGGHGREQMEVAEDKRSPEDFALWKKGDEGRQMNWDSPWGSGFPGWHIECSAMATRYLGEQFDIHTGGLDLMFPHHEDEIAQSQGTFGKEPVKYWVHGEFLIIGNRKMKTSNENGDDGIKMSRSKGNVLLVSTLKEEGIDPMAFRYLMLTAHYRSKINYTDDSIQAAQNALNNLRDDLAELPITEQTANWSEEAQRLRDAFREAINNDLDLPTALVLTRETVRNAKIEPAERRHLVLDFDRVLGLRLDTVEPKKPLEISDEVKEIVRQRDEARASKNWKRSDQLRDELKALGFEVRDTPRGTELA
ncbi:cysteine--tRNA ligase [Ktedonobacter robiniae]|uniref:Cysteine--tRNA ligase n=1 Tax=Ktedonobacter robiniae TaxID=2778365 RepID=A0ABQ3UQ20_9CHLR|nr:cysteine--tRNA ligase [Ktedonobacter robiniae]GHO54692.1 cysteine--tRNA ligase [Ktedonobacter robiniae]